MHIALLVGGLTAVGVGVFALTGGSTGTLGGLVPGGPDMTVPGFSFTVGKALPVGTLANAKPRQYAAAADSATLAVAQIVDDYYTGAFLDPHAWRNGSYDGAFEAFDPAATAIAKQQLAVLTAGVSAGETYDSIEPSRSTLSTKVLMDAKGHPASVVGIARFTALGKKRDGSTTLIISEGQYFFRQIDGDWKIISFEVERLDHVRAAPPAGVGSATLVPSGSPR